MQDIYRVDQQIWLPCEKTGWRIGTITSVNDTDVTVRTVDGEKLAVAKPLYLAGDRKAPTCADLRTLNPLHDAAGMIRNIGLRPHRNVLAFLMPSMPLHSAG